MAATPRWRLGKPKVAKLSLYCTKTYQHQVSSCCSYYKAYNCSVGIVKRVLPLFPPLAQASPYICQAGILAGGRHNCELSKKSRNVKIDPAATEIHQLTSYPFFAENQKARLLKAVGVGMVILRVRSYFFMFVEL